MAETDEAPWSSVPTKSGSVTLQISNHNPTSRFAVNGGSIEELRAALETVRLEIDDDNRASRATEIGLESMKSFGRTGAVDVLNVGVEAFDEALKLTPQNHAKRPDVLSNMSNAVHLRFQQTGAISDLNNAIELGEKAIKETPAENRTDLASYLCSLGNFLTSRFKSSSPASRLSSDLDAATKSYQDAVQIALGTDPQRSIYLLCLGASFRNRFELNDSVNDWSAAVKAYSEAAKSASRNESLRSASLRDLNLVLVLRLQKALNKSDNEWDSAVQRTEEEQLNSGDSANRPKFLDFLGTLSLSRFH